MREKIYIAGFFVVVGLMIYWGQGLLERSAIVTWGLAFAGTTAAGALGMTLYRVQLELRASRMELARKQAELNFALEVQRALFPHKFPVDRGLKFSGVCVPARGISGDYYDVLPLGNGRVVFALADISGKGISAAILMANLHAVLRTLASRGTAPTEICAQINHHLHQVTDGSRFATFFYAEWNSTERSLCYVNAGHNVPILVGSCRGERLSNGGPPLGLFPDYEYRAGKLSLQPGDLVALYSDGVTEAGIQKGEGFGETRLEALIAAHAGKPLAEIQEQVLSALRDWAGDQLEDDVTLLLVLVGNSGGEAI